VNFNGVGVLGETLLYSKEGKFERYERGFLHSTVAVATDMHLDIEKKKLFLRTQ